MVNFILFPAPVSLHGGGYGWQQSGSAQRQDQPSLGTVTCNGGGRPEKWNFTMNHENSFSWTLPSPKKCSLTIKHGV